MYDYICGEVVSAGAVTLTVEAGGIGYLINATAGCLADARLGDRATVYVWLDIKENSHTLFGFANRAERDFFIRLLGVSGVGAKTALNLLSLGVENLRTAVESGSLSVKGVGQKTADKIVLELRGKMPERDAETGAAIDGLVNLGLSRVSAAELVKSIKTAGMTAEEVVVAALQKWKGGK